MRGKKKSRHRHTFYTKTSNPNLALLQPPPPNATSMSISSSSSTQNNTALQALLASKRAELSSLLTLRDLSTELTNQITSLGAKLETLDNGFEAVAEVMANWGAVLGVLGMVGGEISATEGLGSVVRIPVEGVE